MITIVYAPPREGKTCFLTHIGRELAFDRERNRAMWAEIRYKQACGFEQIETLPPHCVSSNFDMVLRKHGNSPRYSRRINPFKLGYKNPFVETHFNFPYEAIFITEAQKYLNSRMSKFYPDWQSRWYEQHGHNYLDIWLDTQRPNLIDVNVRALAQFIEIVHLDKKYDDYGRVKELRWRIRRIANNELFERYMASGKTDRSCYVEEIVKADYNVFACYDSRSCKPKFYDGHFDSDFDYRSAEPIDEDLEGYIRYLRENDDELPKKFYQKVG